MDVESLFDMLINRLRKYIRLVTGNNSYISVSRFYAMLKNVDRYEITCKKCKRVIITSKTEGKVQCRKCGRRIEI